MSDTISKALTPSRRTVVKGAAWAVPVVAVAAEAPKTAGSLPPVHIDSSTASVCKLSGGSYSKDFGWTDGYVLWATFVNETGGPVSVKVTDMKTNTGTGTLQGVWTATCVATGPFECFEVPAGGTTVGIYANNNGKSASSTVTVSYSWYKNSACTKPAYEYEQVLQGDVTGSPWGGSCQYPSGMDKNCNPPDLTP